MMWCGCRRRRSEWPHRRQPERLHDLRADPYDTNPQGIADPPPPDTMLTPAAVPLEVINPIHAGAPAIGTIPSVPGGNANWPMWGGEIPSQVHEYWHFDAIGGTTALL